jgi:glucose-6-phosphate isomerase/transaldolase/glucose-6-phosphate isomerase
MAVAVAGYVMGINPFDQPNVEAAKALARKNLDEYKSNGALPATTHDLFGGDILVYGKVRGTTVGEALRNFLNQATPGAYVAILAYLKQTPETDKVLTALRMKIRDHCKVATTVGYGPRYLHSTGQLHKGDAGHGLFLQITGQDARDLSIPDGMGESGSSVSFSVLKQAEAIGDEQALVSAGRRVMRFHLTDVGRDLGRLNEALTW